MATANILNWKKEKVGQVELDPQVFEVPVKKEVLFTVVKWQLDGRRQGTHATKTKGLVSGGGKKPFKQKGTGNARQGSTRSPLMPGGGTAFGPLPRSYAFALPKKVRRIGLSMALSHLLGEGKLFVVDKLESKGKTKEMASQLATFGLKKCVVVDAEVNENVRRASRNLPDYKYLPVAGVNVFDLLKYDAAILSKECIETLTQRCLVEKKSETQTEVKAGKKSAKKAEK
jgi:large subunit ribosomal protein L4